MTVEHHDWMLGPSQPVPVATFAIDTEGQWDRQRDDQQLQCPDFWGNRELLCDIALGSIKSRLSPQASIDPRNSPTSLNFVRFHKHLFFSSSLAIQFSISTHTDPQNEIHNSGQFRAQSLPYLCRMHVLWRAPWPLQLVHRGSWSSTYHWSCLESRY